jgi:geranylgeranyl diphosphate synthase type I
MSAVPPPDLDSIPGWIEEHIQLYFHENRQRFDYGELFDPLYFDLAEYVGRKGKRIRPMMMLSVYRALGGSRPLSDKSLLRCAVALEFLHAFILIHDDLIDRSEKRRGLPTFHKMVEARLVPLDGRERVGQNVAMVIGDMLFSMAIDALNQADFDPAVMQNLMRRFLGYVVDTGAGEIYDILLGVRDITRSSGDDIRRTYLLKTTRYTFEAPSVLGAVLAGASEEKTILLQKASEPLGLAFQIQNDLQEFAHFDPSDLLMSADLLEGKKTLLLRSAFDSLSDPDRSFLQMCLASGQNNEATILKIRDLIIRSGAPARLQAQVAELFTESESVLLHGGLSPAESSGLLAAIHQVRQQVKASA